MTESPAGGAEPAPLSTSPPDFPPRADSSLNPRMAAITRSIAASMGLAAPVSLREILLGSAPGTNRPRSGSPNAGRPDKVKAHLALSTAELAAKNEKRSPAFNAKCACSVPAPA